MKSLCKSIRATAARVHASLGWHGPDTEQHNPTCEKSVPKPPLAPRTMTSLISAVAIVSTLPHAIILSFSRTRATKDQRAAVSRDCNLLALHCHHELQPCGLSAT